MTILPAGQDDPELAKLLSDELDALNHAAIGSDDETPFAIRVTGEDGALAGGITGWTWGGCGGITSLWLAPKLRGQGLGGRLLAAAEAEIRRRGCDRVVVATMSFQAPGFYLQHGYQEVGRTPDMPDGTAKFHFHKRLSAVDELREIDVNGVTLAYRVAGDPAGPPMVLLHGLGDDERDWRSVLPGLIKKHRVYALDARGHGRSSHPGRYSFELMRDDVVGFLAAVGVERPVLIGHSMGGTVAILLAEAAPHLVTHLILEDVTAPRPGTMDRPPLEQPAEPTPFDFAAVNAIRAQLTAPDPAWWDGLAAVRVPTLIIGGADSHIPPRLLAETVELMPDARLVTLDAGHHVHRDRPAEFLTAVDDFLTARAEPRSA